MNGIVKRMMIPAVFALFTACGNKEKPSMTGEDPVQVSDFIDFFKPLRLSYQLADSMLVKKEKDSLLVSHKIVTQFVPDSVFHPVFGKGVKPKFYALGKVQVPGAESYLFVKGIANERKAVYILAFDKQHQFLAGMTVLRSGLNTATMHSFTMDRNFSLTKTVIRRNPNSSMSEGKEVFILNGETKSFMLIMTDAFEDKPTELINPIDTLPRKHKFSADYGSGKMNLVSIRDGRKTDRVSFFIHFEKNNGECSGELKGEAMMLSSSVAEYREEGDPCILKFNFSSGSVTLKEEGACGSRRGLQCLFDGSFLRKKEIKPKIIAPKPAAKK